MTLSTFSFHEMVADELADLPEDAPVGSTAVILGSGDLYYMTRDSGWGPLSGNIRLVGPQGAKGEQGEPGPSVRGEKGQTGDPGPMPDENALVAAIEHVIAIGAADRLKGAKGDPGERGEQGFEGAESNVPGPPGPPGPSIPGPQGIPGARGDRGPRGPMWDAEALEAVVERVLASRTSV